MSKAGRFDLLDEVTKVRKAHGARSQVDEVIRKINRAWQDEIDHNDLLIEALIFQTKAYAYNKSRNRMTHDEAKEYTEENWEQYLTGKARKALLAFR